MKKDIRGANNPHWKGGQIKHQNRILIQTPEHPRNNNGYILRVILIVEKVLGKRLPIGAVIHHINENSMNDDNSNLIVCENRAYHNLLHLRMRALKACEHADWRKCKFCKQWDDPIKLYIPPIGWNTYHPNCVNQYNRERYHRLNNS